MIEYPKRPEGTREEQIAALWEFLWRLVEELNRLELERKEQ